MRSATIAILVAASLLTSSVALADGPKSSKNKRGKAKKAEPVLVAAAVPEEPLPQLPSPAAAQVTPTAPAAAAPAPAGKDEAANKAAAGEPPAAGPGFVISFGSGIGFLGGEAAKDISISAMHFTFDLKLGGYVTRHVGIMAGVQGGYGTLFEGCAGTCSSAYAYQFPVVAQYAMQDRSRGAYFEGGLAFLPTYGASTDTTNHPERSPETLQVSAPVDFKLAVGYRIPTGATAEKAATSACDLRLGLDFGQFKSLEYASVAGSVAGDISSDHQTMHFALGLGVDYHFAP